MAVPWVLLLAAGVAFGQKCKLSTTITKAPGVLVDRMPQTQGTYEPSTDCHWKISTASPNKVVQLDVDIVDLTMDVYNDVLLINLGVDAAVPQGWSRYSRNTDIMGQDNVGAFDYTSTIPGSCTSVQGSSFDPMTCSLTDGSLLTDRRRDGSWIYFTGAGNGIVPFTLVSMAPDVFIVFRSFAKMNSVNDGNTGVSGVRISYSFVSAYCDGATVLTPRLEATDANSVSMEMQIKDNMAGTTKPNMNCSWLLQPFRDGAARVPFDSIWLDFRTFDLKGGAIVSMYDGTSANAPLLAQFIETNGPQDTIKTPRAHVYITYFTDHGPPSAGFTLGWKASYCPNACTGPSHGTCVLGSCDCNKGWDGNACNIPEGWLCAASHYDSNDGCDCGCGLFDPDCGSLNPALMTCTRTKASSSVVAYDGAAGRLFSGDCAYCPLPPAITVQPQLPNVDWDGNALEQSCPDVFQCPHGTQCSPTGMCTKVADAAPPDISIRRQCTSSTDCPDATVCNAQHICEAPANYALRLTSATTATVCSIYGIPSTPDFTVELRLQVLSPPVGNDILVQHPDLAIKRSSGLTITVGMSPPWITAVNVADGHWHSIVWVWANAAGTMSVYEMSATNDAMLVASTTSISPNVPLSANQNVTLGPMDGAISFMRMWTEVRPVATFFQPSPDRLHLLAEYRFMEGSSRDLSANQNDMATPTLSFGAYPPKPYDCVASPFTIPNGLAVGAVVAVTATSTRPWRIGVFNAGNVRVLAVTGSTNLVDIAVDGASVATIAVADVTAKALLIRLHRTSSTEIEVCVNDVACKTIAAPSTAMAYVAVNTAPYAGSSAGLQSPCLVHVESLAALAPIVSVPTKTVDGADCDFPFAMSSRNCNAFSTYLATKAYTATAFVPLAKAYAVGHHLDSADEECQCDDMPTWSTNFKISQVDSATPTTIVATVDYIKIKTRINDPGGGGIQCGATCYMLEVPGHRRLAGGPPGPPPTSTTPPPPPPPGPTPASVPVYDSGTLARMYNVKRDFVFVDNAGSWSVQSATADGIVSSTNCLITGPDASQVVESLTSFSCQTLGDTTMDAPSLPYCILHNAKKTCQSDYDGCSLTNGAATMTSLDGSFSDNYKGSITTGVHVCAFHVQPAVPEPLRQYANVSYTIQTAELSASDELQVTDSAGRPLGPAISGPVAFADLPTKAMVSGLAATFTLRTAGDKTSNTNDGFVVEYDTMYSFPDAATAHFCGAAQTSMTVSGATIFPTTSFATAVAYPALANCTYVLRAPPASYSSIWLDFLDFSMASTSDRMELYDADTSPPTLLAAFTNTTYALPHYGIVFTGQADYILSSSSLAALPRTVVFWIQVPVTVQKDCTVANACTNNVAKKMKVLGTEFKSSAACAKFNVELDVDTGFLSMFLNGANHVIEQDVRQGSWLHVALVYRELDNVMFGYLNGVRVAMSAVTGVFNPSLPPCSSDVLFLGGQPSLPDDRNVFFNGMLRQVALYADAKTIYHVGRLMGRPCDATDAALLVCYAFTSIDASTATDDSSYELHGRFHGTSLYTQNPLQLSSLLHKTFTSASATVIVRYFPTSANSTFRFLAMPKVCPPCASHGTCRRGQCHCDSGYTGATCNMVVDACPQDVLVPSKKGVLVFPTKAPTVGHFVPSVPSGGYPAALDCSFHLRKSSSKIVLTFAKLDLDESDAIMVYEGRRESPRYLASHNLTADVAMDSASYFSRGAYGYSRVIFKNVSAYDATAVLWPVVAAPQPGNCSKTFHVVKYRRGMACADATSVGLNQTWAAHLISSYWWLESPEAFSTQITPRRLVFNDYTADAATVTTEFTKLVLGQGKVTRPHPGVFRFRRRTQPFTTCQDGSSEGLDIVSLVEATGTHTFSRPDAAVGYQQAPIVSPVFRYAGTWSLDTSKPFSGVFRSPGFVPQVGSSPFTIVVRATVALTSEVQYLFAQEDNPASSIFLKISESRRGLGKWTFGAYATNDKATPASPASFSRDTIMLAITFNNGVVSYYVNGVLFGTHDTDASYQACVDQCILDDTDPWWECRNQEPMYNFGHSNRLVMGGRFQGSTVLNPWKGQILELSVYDMALPDAVVASLFTGVGAISSSVSKFSVNSFASPTQGEASTIEVLTVPVGNDQQASSTFIRRWHVHRYACATPAPSLDTPHLATILNASSALTKVVYNAMDDTAALVSWSTASSPFVQTSLVRSKSYGHGLTATAIVDLLVEYGLANDNFPYVVTAVFVTAITSTSASVGFRFLDAQRQIVEATATLPRVNNTWTHPTAVHRLTVPPYGVLPPTKCRDDRDSTVPLTDTSGILSDGGATESSIVAPNTQCSWVLRAPVGETITISFTYFFIDCMEGDLTIDDVDAHTSTPLCGSMAGWSATFGANVRLNYHIGPPPMGMNNHPMPMMSTGFFGQYVFSNDNPVLDTTEGAATFGPWTVAAADAVRPGSTQCQVDTNDEAPSYEWKIQESSVQTNMDDTCYQTQLNDADFEWEVESFDLATGDTIQCKDDKWVVDETMPWTAVAMDRVGGTERYTDPPTTVEHAPAFNLTKATQSLAATYVSERNALQVRIQSSAGGRGRAVIEYYMPQIYYVAPASYQGVDGSNGDGSREMPFTHSFQYLMANVLASGDMLRLYPGRYEGTGYCNLVWTEPVVMESISGPEWTVLDCNGLSRGWQLKHASGLSILKGITFTHTMVSSTPFTGAAVLASGDVHIESCVFDSNVHRAQGTLAIVAPSVSKVVNCSFVSNSGLSGPAIAVLSATATLDAIRAVDNFASVSGALFVSTYVEGATMSLSSPSRVVVSKSVFLRNKGSKEGALTVARSSVVDVTSCEFIATAAAAIAVDASTLKLDKSIMQGNLGSGILASNAALVVATSSTFAGNAAKSGAAVSLDASSYQGRGNAYTGNTATVAGGAIYGQGCHYTEVDSSFVGNAVGNATNAIGGGALAFTSSNSAVDSATFQVVVQRCLLQSNAATFGGAMQLGDVHAALVSNQFVRNSAGRFGGAIRVANCMAQRDEVVLDVRDNDFNGNTAGRGAAAYVEASDVVQFVANTFRGNSAASFGGAIAVVATSRVQITTSTFQGCVSSGGGAVYAASETTLDIVDSTFAQCSSRSHGGSVYVENSQLALANVNVQGGNASGNGGAIVLMSQGTSIRATNVTIASTSANKGGAFYLIDCNILAGHVSDVRVVNTSAVHMGGAFYAVLVTMDLTRLTAIDTSSASGGMMTLEDSTATLTDSTVLRSTSLKNGGAFYVIISDLALVSSTIDHNRATNYGGSVYGFASHVTLVDSSLRQSTSEFGGGLYVSSSTLAIVRSTIRSNDADAGGALYADLTDVAIRDSTFHANVAATSGGVAFISSNSVQLDNSTFTSNVANQGGALCLAGLTSLAVVNCAFADNSVANTAATTLRPLGGAIYVDQIEENSTMSTCVFHNNSAGDAGGAMYVSNAAASSSRNRPTLSVAHTTFRANVADTFGGAVFIDGLETSLQANVFTANVAARGGGGAIFWQGSAEPVGLPLQTYAGNSAEYGPAYGSVAVALRPIYIPPPSLVVGQPGGEGSAQPFVGSFTVHVVDKYMQTVATENSVQVSIESNTVGAFVTGTTKVTARHGVANFTQAGVQQMPGSNATVSVSASGLVALATVELRIRRCVRGEVTPVGVPQCVKCPFGQFSWNTSDTVCHECPVGGVCGGGDNIEVLDGYWRFENSTGVCNDPSYPYDGCRLGTCLDKACNGFTKGDVSATVRLDGPNNTMILTIRSDTIGYQPNDTLFVQGEELRVVSVEKIGDGTASFQHHVLVTGNALSTTGTVDIYVRGTERCKPGYTGNLCFQCAPGYTRSGKTACTACPDSLTLTVVVLVLGVFGVGAVAMILIVMTINKSRQKADLYSILTKIFTSYLQLVSLAGSFDMQWPQQVKAMFAGQAQISNPGDKLISIECLMDQYKRTMRANAFTTLSNYYMQLIVFLTLPVCAVVFPLVFWRVRFRLASRRIVRRDWGVALNAVLGRGTGSDVMLQDQELADVLVAVQEKPSDIVLDYVRTISKIADGPQPLSVVKASFLQATRDEMRDKTVLSIIVLMFLVHPGLSNQIFQLYTCTELGYDGGGTRLYFLNPDLDVQCYDATHYKWMYFVGVPALVLYTVGIPYFAFHQLRTRRHDLDKPRTKLQFGFLYDGYKLDHYYWEIWIMMRKIIVSFISVFLKNWGTAPQALGASGLVFFALWGHMETWPYEADCVNGLEQKALLACLFTLYCGLYLLQPEVTTVTRVVIGAFIITANSLFLVYFSRLMIVQVKQKAQNAIGKLSRQKYVSMAVKKVRKSSVGETKRPMKKSEQAIAPDTTMEQQLEQRLDNTDI